MAEITIRNLIPGGRYGVQVRAANPERSSPWSNQFTFNIAKDATPPETPQINRWESVGNDFVADWSASTALDFKHFVVRIWIGAEEYVFETTATSYVFSLDLNRSVFIQPKGKLNIDVTAYDTTDNASGTATKYAENAPPAAPTGFNATPGVDLINLKWNANTDPDLWRYDIDVVTNTTDTRPVTLDSTTGWTGAAATQATSFVFSSAIPPSYHWFRIRAVDIFNQPSAWVEHSPAGGILPSSAFDADTDPPVLSPTHSVKNTPSTDPPGLVVTWGTATDDAGVYQYEVRWQPVGSSTWNYHLVSETDTSYVISDVVVGTQYNVQLAAVDKANNRSSFITVSGSPITVTASTRAPDNTGWTVGMKSFDTFQSLSMYWNEHPQADVKWGAGLYEVQVDTTAQGVTIAPSFASTNANFQTQRTGAPSAVFNNVVRDLKYWIRVRAINSSGVAGPWMGGADTAEFTNVIGLVIDDIPIGTLPADVLQANSAIVHKIFIKSEPGNTGSIETTDYSATAGFKLDPTGLFINSGLVRARALEIQSGANILPPIYTFDWRPDVYKNTTPNQTLATSNVTFSTTATGARGGGQALALTNTTTTAAPAAGYAFLADSTTTYNLPIDQGRSWIASTYVYNPSGTETISVTLRVRQNDGGTYPLEKQANIGPGTTVRVSGAFTPSAATTALVVAPYVDTPAATAHFSAIQIEEKIGASDAPSAYSKPGLTKLDGAGITTGTIRSTNTVSVGGITQPYWSFSNTGDAIIGSAYIRGQLIVGAPTNLDGFGANTTGISVRSHNYAAGSGATAGTGWAIKSEGDVEFNNGTFRGIIYANAGQFKGDLSGATGTFSGSLNVSNNFYVDANGNLGIGTGTSATDTVNSFRVTSTGILYATSANITGDIKSGSTISGATISGTNISIVSGSTTFAVGPSHTDPLYSTPMLSWSHSFYSAGQLPRVSMYNGAAIAESSLSIRGPSDVTTGAPMAIGVGKAFIVFNSASGNILQLEPTKITLGYGSGASVMAMPRMTQGGAFTGGPFAVLDSNNWSSYVTHPVSSVNGRTGAVSGLSESGHAHGNVTVIRRGNTTLTPSSGSWTVAHGLGVVPATIQLTTSSSRIISLRSGTGFESGADATYIYGSAFNHDGTAITTSFRVSWMVTN